MTPVLRCPEKYSRCGLTRDEYRGRITSPFLLALLQLVQPRSTSTFFFFFFLLAVSQHVLLPKDLPSQVHNFTLSYVLLHEVPVSPLLQSDEIPQHSSELYIISNLAEGPLCPIIQITDQDRHYYAFPVLLFSHSAEPCKEENNTNLLNQVRKKMSSPELHKLYQS